ncbi:MAG: RdgB/HAM1 family non-canonical purine NTP pyrophosphatase [Clostridia bacterium]|nr:RdgB/HAM1 family non-canonical purine NTP pyrophosphatase [Clostridia bacterium]
MQQNQKQRLVVATGNAHKLREIAEIFTQYEVVSQKQMGFCEEVDETGTTFQENALIKARAACRALGESVLADDSGLCVEALGGAPGIYSARYCGRHGSDEENRAVLLKNMAGVENRRAYFTSAIAIVTPDGEELVVEGRTYGHILLEEQGEGGFGYDCLFFSDDLQKSFGEATAEEKNGVSHRFRALQAILKLLKDREQV